jgi:hypothetical protein
MKHLHRHLMFATALAGGLVLAAPLVISQVNAGESTAAPINSGFKPDTGQINPGATYQAASTSIDVRKIPTPAESRAALMMPDDPNPSLGPELPQTQASGASDKMAASPAASGGGSTGPIGATGQTMPAKLSTRNDVLDRVPIMAWPMSLSDQERQQIYLAVMAEKSQPAANADKLAPASELSTDHALNDMHALPASLRGIAALTGLQYVKTKDKVLLVQASTRTVVEQISPS